MNALHANDSFELPLRMPVERCPFAKHRSDAGVFDDEGRFDAAALEALLRAYDPKGRGFVTTGALQQLMQDRREDIEGASISRGEFRLLLEVAGREQDVDVDGRRERVVHVEDLLHLYKGSLFHRSATAAPETRAKPEPDGCWLRADGRGLSFWGGHAQESRRRVVG